MSLTPAELRNKPWVRPCKRCGEAFVLPEGTAYGPRRYCDSCLKVWDSRHGRPFRVPQRSAVPSV